MTRSSGERSELGHLVDKVQDTLSGLAGRANAAIVSDAQTFVHQAAISDLYEIEAAEVVLARGATPSVLSTAKKMIADHTTSSNQLKAALQTDEASGVAALPNELDSRRQKMVEHLKTAPAGQVERLYIDQQLMAHQEALTLLRGYEKKGDNAQLRSFAASTAPMVERHLEHVKAVETELGRQ